MNKESKSAKNPCLSSGTWYGELYKDGHIKSVNISQEVRQLLGYEPQDKFPDEPEAMLKHIHPDDRHNMIEEIIAAGINGDMAADTSLRLKTKSGEYIPTSSSLKLIRLPDGTPYMLHGILVALSPGDEEDKTDMDGDIQQDNSEKSALSNKFTNTFLFNVSHKMLTPMNAMMEFTNILDNNLENVKLARDYIKEIKKSHNYLWAIINHVLELARIESGTVNIEEAYHNVSNMVKAISSDVKATAKNKKIKFTSNINVKHKDLMVDFTRVKEILILIINNAIRHSPAGGQIDISINELESDSPEHAVFQTTISEASTVISPDELPYVFEAFSKNLPTNQGGVLITGLEMYLVKELVTFLNGTIEVHSQPKKGTWFVITIPHRLAVPHSTDEKATDAQANGMRILLAEDNELNADIAITLLEDKGFNIHRAVDGAQCVELLKKSPPGYYDVILMDMQMPNMNGDEATKAIRRLKQPGYSTIPIIAMTANASVADKRDALLGGMNAHVAKPFDVDKLYATILNVLEHKSYYIHSDALEKFKEKYTKLGCLCGFFIYRIDLDEKILFADQGTADIFGCTDEKDFLQFVNGTFKTMVHADDIEQVQKAISQQQSSSSANLDLVDYDIVRKDGKIRHLADIGYKVFDGEKLVYFVYIADITDIQAK